MGPRPPLTEPLDDQHSAMERGAGITVGQENLRTGDGPSTSHTPPGGSPHIKPTRPPPTSCPGTPRRFPHTEPTAPAGPITNHQKGRRPRKLNELVSSAI